MSLIKERLNIKAWALEDRPREKLAENGASSLSASELIAIIIGSGTKKITAVELAKQILSSINHDLNELGKLNIKEFTKFTGIGKVKAIGIIAALELGRRRLKEPGLQKNQLTSSRDVAEVFQFVLSDKKHEEFWILLLNRANKMISKHVISSGGVAGTVVDIKILFKLAIENLASSVILCHNHPSGNLKPSAADIALTKKIKESGSILDIKVIDHIIIAGLGYFSFADEGIL
jgi:DNA repair protein RadC